MVFIKKQKAILDNIGFNIKIERKNQNIKQAALAKGICSISYLSKIENGKILPNEDIVELLLRRLNIEIIEVCSKEEDDIISSLLELYKEGLLYRNQNLIRKQLPKFIDIKFRFQETDNLYLYHLLMFRLLLITNDNSTDYESKIIQLKSIENKLSEKLKFIYYFNLALYYYSLNDNPNLVSYFKKSLRQKEYVMLHEWENADFYNALSLFYLKGRDYFNVVKYSSMALEYYKDNHYFERIIDGSIVLGIAQRNLLEFKNAEVNFSAAYKLTKRLNLSIYNGMIHHNFGALYSAQGNCEEAIKNFEKSFSYKQENSQLSTSFSTILCIIREYSKQGDSSNVLKWCNIGIDLLNDNCELKTFFHSYFFHFNVYRAKYSAYADYEIVLKKSVKYFKKIKDYRYVQKYSMMLGDYYRNQSKYKAASLYYQYSSLSALKQKKITSVEDL